MARTLELALEHLNKVLDALDGAGFVISPGKTDTAESSAQVKLYLGFVIDSVHMTVSISKEKLADVRKAIKEVLSTAEKVRAKCLAKGIGKLIAVEQALGPVVQLLSRFAQNELATATDDIGWNCTLKLSGDATQSLQIMESSLEEFNGFPVKNLATAKTLDIFIEHSAETSGKEAPAQLLAAGNDPTRTMAGDASAVATCALEVGKEKLSLIHI